MRSLQEAPQEILPGLEPHFKHPYTHDIPQGAGIIVVIAGEYLNLTVQDPCKASAVYSTQIGRVNEGLDQGIFILLREILAKDQNEQIYCLRRGDPIFSKTAKRIMH